MNAPADWHDLIAELDRWALAGRRIALWLRDDDAVAPSDQLTKGIIGVDVHADLPEVCRVLGENHLKKVPVLDEGQVVGVINRSDITHYSMQQYLAERDAEAASKLERSEEAAALPDDEAMASSI